MGPGSRACRSSVLRVLFTVCVTLSGRYDNWNLGGVMLGNVASTAVLLLLFVGVPGHRGGKVKYDYAPAVAGEPPLTAFSDHRPVARPAAAGCRRAA